MVLVTSSQDLICFFPHNWKRLATLIKKLNDVSSLEILKDASRFMCRRINKWIFMNLKSTSSETGKTNTQLYRRFQLQKCAYKGIYKTKNTKMEWWLIVILDGRLLGIDTLTKNLLVLSSALYHKVITYYELLSNGNQFSRKFLLHESIVCAR